MRKQFRHSLEPGSCKGSIGGGLFGTELEGDEIPPNTEHPPETAHPDLENLPLARVGSNLLASTGFCWLFSGNTKVSLIK